MNKEQNFRDFAKWVAKEIFSDDWEDSYDFFAEIACRKLEKLGLVEAKQNEWILKEEDISDTNNNVR